MSIIRVKKDKNNPYLIMNKTALNDSRLSLKAKGLICYLLSKPDNWYVNTNEIISCSTNGKESVWSAMKELVKFGYMYKHRFRSGNGAFHSYNYLVYECPHKKSFTQLESSPHSAFPSVVNPSLDNPTLLNNKTKISNKTFLTTSSNKSNNTDVVQNELISKESREQTKLLLNELYINNHQFLFDSFDDFDIFTYADWMLSFKSKIKNPIGFIIAALKGRWLDVSKYWKLPPEFREDSDQCPK